MKRRNVVEDPHRSALRRDDKILVMELDVVDRNVRQVQIEGLPVRTVVERNEHSKLGAGVQQTLSVRVLANNTRRPVVRNTILAISQFRPRRAVVICLIDVWLEIAKQIAI